MTQHSIQATLTAVLYPILFSPQPVNDAARAAKMFLIQQTPLDLPFVTATIRAELAQPTIELRALIPGLERFTNDELRSYLARFLVLLEAQKH